MIRKIKDEIKRVVDFRVKMLKNQQRLNAQQHFNYVQISQLFKEESFIPFSAWAISPSTILHVLNDIIINKRKTIIEFGAGASTLYIAKLLKVLKIDALFYSVESDEHWLKELQRQLEIYNLEQYVTIVYAPLAEVDSNFSYKTQKTWYHTEVLETALKDISKIDLVLVDGPFGGSSPFARYSAIPYLRQKIANSCSIYLDDVKRPDEQKIALKWKEMLNYNIQYFEGYAVLSNVQDFNVAPFQLKSLPL